MRQFRPSYEYKFKIVRILHETAKAILFLMKEHKVSIWVPKVWINRRGKTFFTVSDRKATPPSALVYLVLVPGIIKNIPIPERE